MTGVMAFNGPGPLDCTSDQQTVAMMALSEAAMEQLATGGDDGQPEAAPLEVTVTSKATWRPDHADLREFTAAEVTRRFRTSAKVRGHAIVCIPHAYVRSIDRLFYVEHVHMSTMMSQARSCLQFAGDPLLRAWFRVVQVTSMDMTPDGCYVVAGCSDGSIRLFSMTKHSQVRHITQQPVQCVDTDPLVC